MAHRGSLYRGKIKNRRQGIGAMILLFYARVPRLCGCVIGVDVIACHDSVWLVTVQGGVALVVTVIFTTLLIGWECADVQGGLYA